MSLIRDIGLFGVAVVAPVMIIGGVGYVTTLFPLWVQWLVIGLLSGILVLLLIVVLSSRRPRQTHHVPRPAGWDISIDDEG